jgi:hypothetical protein
VASAPSEGSLATSTAVHESARRDLIDTSEFALDGLDVRAHFGVVRAKGLHLANGADDGRVIAISERATELGKAALQALLAQVHRNVAGERNTFVPIFREQIGRSKLEVVADDALNVLDARFVRA